MIDYFKVYQSIDDNIQKNVSEVIKPNENLSHVYSNLCLVFFIITIFSFIICYLLYSDSNSNKCYLICFILNIFSLVLFLIFLFLGSSQEEKEEKDYQHYL